MGHRVRAAGQPGQTGRTAGGRLRLSSLLVVLVVLALAACGGDGETGASGGTEGAGAGDGAETEAATEAAGDESAADLRVALVTPGPVSDQGYNAAAARGLEMAKEEWGIETAISDNVPPGAEAAQVIRGYAADGFDVILGHGEHNQGPMEQIAAEFPDVKFFVHAGDLEGVDNVTSSYLAVEEPGYLEGILAGHLTESNRIGFVGFVPIAVIVRAMNAVELGAQTINEEITVDNVFTNNLVDPSVAREATNALIGNGADVIIHINGGTNAADIINAAKEADIPAMGWPVDQSELAPDTMVTSLTVNYPQLVMEEIGAVINGEFQGGITHYGLESEIVGIAPIADWVPEEAVADVEEAREKIISGELQIDVPGELEDS